MEVFETINNTQILVSFQMLLFVGTATQLVILPPHIPWIGQGDGILLLGYSMICVIGFAIFDF